jgi:hypothetical protein
LLCFCIRIFAVGGLLGLVTGVAIVVVILGFVLFFEELFSCRSYVTSITWAVVCFWSVNEIFVLCSIVFGVSLALLGHFPSPGAASISFGGGYPLVISLPFGHGRYLLFYVVCSSFLRAINLALMSGCALELYRNDVMVDCHISKL